MNLHLLEPAIELTFPEHDSRVYGASLRPSSVVLSLLLSIVMLPCPIVSAQAARSDGTRVLQESWTTQQGAPEGTTSLAQTTDGFLWLGGPTGLFRFDGTRFERFHALLSTPVENSPKFRLKIPQPSGSGG